MLSKIFRYRNNIFIKFISIFYIVCAWFELELTQGYSSKSQIFHMDIKYIILNTFTLGVIYVLLAIITNRYSVAGTIFNIFIFIVAVINYYTVELHGLPLTVHEIGNFKTAMNVLGDYNIVINRYVAIIICISFINIILCIISCRYEQKIPRRKNIIRNLIFILAGTLGMYVGYFSGNPIKPKTTIGWTWKDAYRTYGYVACSVEDIVKAFHIYNVPEGYSEEKLASIEIEYENADVQTPDIILILNETFYDLDVISDVETDIPYLDNFYKMDNVIRGYAVVPHSGGGTNNSEYELLTSNAYSIFNSSITPFNVLDMKKANSVVSYLNDLNYITIGAHAADAVNYNRERAYPDMRFDETYFIEDFENIEYYGKRKLITDATMYHNLYKWYESYAVNLPFFAYLLTIQNHGGWETNLQEEDTVHLKNSYGELDETINEFLSCIRLSDIAFSDLTAYFEQVARPVIICMVGDHAPWFASEIAREGLSEQEKKILERSTPFIIWANYDIEDKDLGFISLNYLVPTLLETARVNLSPYYQYMLNLREEVPILTSYGCYVDAQGNEYAYDEETTYSEKVNNYFYLEYNNLSDKRKQDLFSPK